MDTLRNESSSAGTARRRFGNRRTSAGYAVLLDQHAAQAVAGLLTLLLDDVQQVGQRLRHRAERRARAAEQVEAGGAQPLEVLAVLVGHAEQLADRQRRDRQRERLPQVD